MKPRCALYFQLIVNKAIIPPIKLKKKNRIKISIKSLSFDMIKKIIWLKNKKEKKK